MATLTAGGRIAGGVVITVYSDAKIAAGLGVELAGPYKVKVPASAGSNKVIGQVVKAARADGEDMAIECRGKAVQVMKSGAALATCGPVVLDAAGKPIAYVAATHTAADCIYGWNLTTTTAADQDVDILVK